MAEWPYSPRHAWWGYIKHMIRKYKQRQHDTDLYGTELREVEAVRRAIERVQDMPDGNVRLSLVDLVFWRRTHTIQGAAMALHISERTANRMHSHFIRTVAAEFGLDEGKRRPNTQKSKDDR